MQVAVAGNSEIWWKHAGSNVRRECHCISRRQVSCKPWLTVYAVYCLTVLKIALNSGDNS